MNVVKAFLNLIANTDIYIDVPLNWEINKEILKDTPK